MLKLSETNVENSNVKIKIYFHDFYHKIVIIVCLIVLIIKQFGINYDVLNIYPQLILPQKTFSLLKSIWLTVHGLKTELKTGRLTA